MPAAYVSQDNAQPTFLESVLGDISTRFLYIAVWLVLLGSRKKKKILPCSNSGLPVSSWSTSWVYTAWCQGEETGVLIDMTYTRGKLTASQEDKEGVVSVHLG